MWRDHTPPGFVFAVKESRYITHMLKPRNCEAALAQGAEIAAYEAIVDPAASSRGCINANHTGGTAASRMQPA